MTARYLLPVAVLSALGLVACLPPATAVAAPAATAPAAGALERGPEEPLVRLHKILEGLDLSADQKTQLKTILEPFRQEIETWRVTNKAALEKIRGEVQAAREAKDRAAMKTALTDLRTLLETAPKLKEILPQIKGVLTPAQWDKLKDRLEELREKVQERREKNGPATQPAGG